MKNIAAFICTDGESIHQQNAKILQQLIIADRNDWRVLAIIRGDKRDGRQMMRTLYRLIDEGETDYILSDSPQTFANALGSDLMSARRYVYRISQENMGVLFSEEPFFDCLPSIYFEDTPGTWSSNEAERYADFLKELNRCDLNREGWNRIGRGKRRC